MNLKELNNKELFEISGGLAQPAYGLGYYLGRPLYLLNRALGEFFFAEDSIWAR
jgi:bacteriocin-like protein